MREGVGVDVLEHPDRSVLVQSQVIGVIGNHGGAGSGELVAIFITIVTVTAVLLVNNGSKDLNFTTENHGKAFTTDGLFYARKTSTVTPFIEFTAKSVGLEFDEPQLAGSKETMTARCVDVSDRRVDD
jgi:hypothetical protein